MARHHLVLLLLVALVSGGAPLSWARSAGSTPETKIDDIDFGVPRFIASPSAQRVLAEINLREDQLLELARWLSLEEAIQTALVNNPELAAAYSAIEGQRWSVIAARRRWYPTLSISPRRQSSLQLDEETTTRNSATTSVVTRSLNTEVKLNWTFFDLSRGPAIDAAIGDLKAQRYLFDVAARNLVLDVQAAYFRLQEQIELVNQYKSITLLTSQQLDLALQRQLQGRVTGNEIDQLRTTQRSELTTLINAYVGLYEVSIELSRLLGLPGLTLVMAADSTQASPVWPDDVQTTMAHAEAFREEIQAQLQQSQSQRWRSSELLGAYWPRLSLLGVGDLDGFSNRSSDSAVISNTGTTTNIRGAVGVALNWSLFDGGIKAAEAVNRRIAAQTLDLQANSTRLQVSAQVRQAYARYVGAMLQVENTRDALQDSANAFRGAINLFQTGAVNATTLIQTQAQLVQAITDAAAAQRLQNTAMAELYRYSARWPPDVQRLFEQRLDQWRQRGVSP